MRHVGLAFTGPDVVPAAVTMDKALTKRVLVGAGMRTPTWADFPPTGDDGFEWVTWMGEVEQRMSFPWIVKPRQLGSSVGIETFAEPVEFLRRATEVGVEAWCPHRALAGAGCIVEEIVGGRELTCAVIDTDDGPLALPPIEIRPRDGQFFDYHAKYTPGATDEICPAPLADEETARVREIALRVHRLFECSPLSRTDLFLEETGALSVLEVNTLPGMTEISLVPRAAQAAGMSMADVLDRLVVHALAREAGREPVVVR